MFEGDTVWESVRERVSEPLPAKPLEAEKVGLREWEDVKAGDCEAVTLGVTVLQRAAMVRVGEGEKEAMDCEGKAVRLGAEGEALLEA